MAKFQKGVSGNPAGKKPGQTPGVQLRKAIAERAPELIEVLINQALEGDVLANKALLDRCVPVLKSQNLPVIIQPGSDLTETGKNVIDATLDGEISPDSSALLLTSLGNLARITEVSDLENRIRKLEGLDSE